MTSEEKCIYCGRSDKLCLHSHAVPRCMGTFENQSTLMNRVCQECDREIGKCEGQLIKCGIEAMLRMQAGIVGRSGKSSPSPSRQRHYGYEPIRVEMEFPYTGWKVLVEPREDNSTCEPLPQIVMIGSDGHCGQILIKEAKSLTADTLKLEIAKLGEHEWRKAWAVQLADSDVDHIFGLLDQMGLLGSEECLTNIKPLDGTIKMRASGVAIYGREYFRAIAKIAFLTFSFTRGSLMVRNPSLREYVDSFVMEKETKGIL